MRNFKKLLLPSFVILLTSILFGPAANAEMVIFRFTGRTQATIDGMFFSDVAFEVISTIDSNSVDQFPFQTNRGAFLGAVTTLSIPSAGINEAQSTNITGILQEDFGSSRFQLTNSSFNQSALTVGFGSSVLTDADTINPFIEPTPTPTNFQGGLPFQLLLGPDVTFNSIREVAVSSSFATTPTAAVPEPTSFLLCSMGLLAVSFKRRRR